MKPSPYISAYEEEILGGHRIIVLEGNNPTEMDEAVITNLGKISRWMGVSNLRFLSAKKVKRGLLEMMGRSIKPYNELTYGDRIRFF